MSSIKRIDQVLNGIPDDWKNILYSSEEHKLGRAMRTSKQLLDRVIEDLQDIPDGNLCPEPPEWLNFARLTPLDKVRVIVIGQDPYHTKKRGVCYAHGLAFSCLGNVPPSLRNIYKCLENRGFLSNQKNIKSGDLTNWAKQGILLLNASLSTEVSTPNEHQFIWASYTEFIIQRICDYAFDRSYQLMFLLWGKNAQKVSNLIDSDFHIIKTWAHPSPMAQGSLSEEKKFINCDHFDDVNEFLVDWDCPPIDWSVNVADPESDSDSDIEELIKEENIKNEPKEEKDSDWFNGHKRKIVVFTDGSCYPNKKSPKARGGYAIAFVQGPLKDNIIYGSLATKKHYASNIRAEGQAIISTLEFIGSKENLPKWSECVIVTDCEFWINMVNKYMPRWSESKFKQKENTDMTMKMWNLWKSLMGEKNKELSLYHVNSHGKAGWNKYKEGTFERYCYDQNDYVDKLCGYARKALKPGDHVVSTAEYE